MAEEPRPAALDRIERAIARVEAAARTRNAEIDRTTRQHAKLRARIAQAIAGLDALIDSA